MDDGTLMRAGLIPLPKADGSPSALPDTGNSPGTETTGWLSVAVLSGFALVGVAFAVWRLVRARDNRWGAS